MPEIVAPPICARCNLPMTRVAFTKSNQIFNCRNCVDDKGVLIDHNTGCEILAWANPSDYNEALRLLRWKA